MGTTPETTALDHLSEEVRAGLKQLRFDKYEKLIGKATNVYLGYEDHGLFVVSIQMDYGTAGGSQGFSCGLSDETALKAMKGIMSAFGVRNWADIVGRTVYVLKDEGWSGFIRGFAPLPTEKGESWCVEELGSQAMRED